MKFKSQFEKSFYGRTKLPYEPVRVPYVQSRTYTPDFQINSTTFVECKGKFSSADRTKHLLIKSQHPELRIIFVFQAPYNKLSKNSKTTYADWATKNGFEWTTLEAFKKEKYL